MVRIAGDREDVKLTLINEAREIFAKNGYNKATVDDIAKSAGKGKSTLYYYFSGKEDIFKSVIEKEANLFRAKIIESISIDASSSEKIKKYISTRLMIFSDLVNLFRAISDNDIERLSFIDDVRTKYENEQINIIKMVLLEASNNDELDVVNVDLVAETIVVVLQGLEYNLMFHPKDMVEIEGKVDKVVNLIYKGIMKR